MLTHIDKMAIYFDAHWNWFRKPKIGHIKLCIGKFWINFYDVTMKPEDFDGFVQRNNPFKFTVSRELGDEVYWLYKSKLYRDKDNLQAHEVKALLDTRAERQQRTINNAMTTSVISNSPRTAKRGFIPDDVKHLVWKRDEGKCNKCSSTTELQYDHIIPVSLGGASTPENIQILCGTCNRAKRVSVA